MSFPQTNADAMPADMRRWMKMETYQPMQEINLIYDKILRTSAGNLFRRSTDESESFPQMNGDEGHADMRRWMKMETHHAMQEISVICDKNLRTSAGNLFRRSANESEFFPQMNAEVGHADYADGCAPSPSRRSKWIFPQMYAEVGHADYADRYAPFHQRLSNLQEKSAKICGKDLRESAGSARSKILEDLSRKSTAWL